MVERQLPKLKFAGPIPVSRSNKKQRIMYALFFIDYTLTIPEKNKLSDCRQSPIDIEKEPLNVERILP